MNFEPLIGFTIWYGDEPGNGTVQNWEVPSAVVAIALLRSEPVGGCVALGDGADYPTLLSIAGEISADRGRPQGAPAASFSQPPRALGL